MVNIDRIAKEKRISKTDIAKRMGLSRESLYRILSGNPTLDNLQKLADALEVPLSDIFADQDSDSFHCPNCGTKLVLKKKE